MALSLDTPRPMRGDSCVGNLQHAQPELECADGHLELDRVALGVGR